MVNFGPSLPAWVLFPATLLVVLILIYPFTSTRSGIARFALFTLCFRYLAQAHHNLTYRGTPFGLTWNAIGSSAIFVIGLLLIKRKHLALKPLTPCYVMIAVVILSALANHAPMDAIDVVVKYGYLAVITISIYEGLSVLGERRMMNLLLWSAVTPLFFQVLSIILGVSKGNEDDGSISYIGGFNHEAGFSVCLAACFVIACFASGLRAWARGVILLIILAGMMAANYRTAILAVAPLAFVQFNADVIERFPPRQRAYIAVGILTITGLCALGAAWMLRERFADLATVFSHLDHLMKPQELFTPEQKRLLSSRPYIWSGYIYGYLDGGLRNLILGFGPNSWIPVFPVYAHNTLVSQLYEYGVVGVVAITSLWATMLFCALRVKRGPRTKLIAAHISFFILNMATMPHWMPEGNILYGIICAYTLYLYYGPATIVASVKSPAPQRPRPRLLSADPEPAPNQPRHAQGLFSSHW